MENPLRAALWDYFLSFYISSHTAQGRIVAALNYSSMFIKP